jgi:hypothetical protein
MVIPEEDHTKFNTVIGERYYLVLKIYNEKKFNEISKKEWDGEVPDDVYGYIGNTFDLMIPLFRNRYYYVMTDSGKTFENISYVERNK